MRAISVLLTLSLFSCDACDEEARLRKEETREGKPLASAAQTDDSLKPVYPVEVGEIPPLVTRLCEALHGIPRKKRAECCQTTPGVLLTSECERNLAGALKSGVFTLGDAPVVACEKEILQLHEGCDWIGPWQPPTPAACLGILDGKSRMGDVCRSNLECQAGMRCLGLGPTDPGRCGPPPPIGSICGASVDPLAVYLRQDDVDLRHPPCDEGYCDRARCVPLIEDGAACRASVQCKSGRCIGGQCTQGASALGAACSGGECGPALRCIENECRAPKSIGAECFDDRECKSACVKGKCQMRCLSPAILRGLIKTKTSTAR